MKKPVAEAVLSAMSNSGQAADQGNQDLVSTSSNGGEFPGNPAPREPAPRKSKFLGKARFLLKSGLGKPGFLESEKLETTWSESNKHLLTRGDLGLRKLRLGA